MKTIKLKTLLLGLILMQIISSCSSTKQSSINGMVARMEVKVPIKGVCDNNNVIVILPFPGSNQVGAVAPITKEELLEALNTKVSFLADKPDYQDKGMVNLIVNCKGELVRCKIDNETKSPELDKQIVAVFAGMKIWTAGSIDSIAFDTVLLYSFTIVDGKISL